MLLCKRTECPLKIGQRDTRSHTDTFSQRQVSWATCVNTWSPVTEIWLQIHGPPAHMVSQFSFYCCSNLCCGQLRLFFNSCYFLLYVFGPCVFVIWTLFYSISGLHTLYYIYNYLQLNTNKPEVLIFAPDGVFPNVKYSLGSAMCNSQPHEAVFHHATLDASTLFTIL